MSRAQRYSAVAIVLHWAIAAAIVANIAIGWWMHRAIEMPPSQARAVVAFQLHKSIGLTVLALSVVRLLWRLRHAPPPLSAHMAARERRAATATHWLFYILIIGIPFSGWLYVSTQWRENIPLNIPTLWFGWFEVPHLFGLNETTRELRQTLAGIAFDIHWYLAWSVGVLLVLHVAAALKHHFINRDPVLGHMIPALSRTTEASPQPRDRLRRAVLSGGFAGIAVAGAAIAFMLFRSPGGAADVDFAALPGQKADTRPAATAITSAPDGWVIDPARSRIAFSGVHAGAAFRGHFMRWNGDIRIDAANVTEAQIAATIETASATDGIPLHDRTMPQAEWFDAVNHPLATFRTQGIRRREGNRYALEGILTIKNHDIAVPSLTLTIDGDTATITGTFEIERREADLGMESDPNGRWVSRDIEVDVRVTALGTTS